MSQSMASLGREAVRAIRQVRSDLSFAPMHWVNKTPKYVSIKIDIDHLTPEELDEVAGILTTSCEGRFLKVYNSTACPTYWSGEDVTTWKEPKVNVRFTQA